MKKIFVLILCLVICVSFSSCAKSGKENAGDISADSQEEGIGETERLEENMEHSTKPAIYAPNRTVLGGKAVDSVDNLANTYYKLTNNKKLNIGYIGGSVTVGVGGKDGYCWRSATTQWFKDNFPAAEIAETNSSWGGTGTYWGYFRLDGAIIAQKPDLIFIEFAINDTYANLSKTQSAAFIEGMVCKIRKALPKTDIAIVLVTDQNLIGTEYSTLAAHKEVAEHYGIPYINVGDALKKEIEKSGNNWEYYVGDIVHPNNKGYKVYADCVAEFLKKHLISAPAEINSPEDHKMPSLDYISNVSKSSQIIAAEELTNAQGWKLYDVKTNSLSFMGKTLYGNKGCTIELEFEGIGIGLLADPSDGAGIVAVIDGTETIRMDMSTSNNQQLICDNLVRGKHTIKIEITSGSRVIVGGVLIAEQCNI